MNSKLLSRFEHPAWLTAIGTLVAWGVILAVVFIVLFAIPYLVVTML